MSNIQLRLFVIVMFVFCGVLSQAQKKQAVYGELLGNGLFYSLNYEYRFSGEDNRWGGKVGVAPYNDVVFTILQGNYLFGQENHFFELGFGTTIYIGYNNDAGKNKVAANAAIQYRYMSNGGFVFRAGFAPVFIPIDKDNQYSDIGKIFWVWPSLSLGYSF